MIYPLFYLFLSSCQIQRNLPFLQMNISIYTNLTTRARYNARSIFLAEINRFELRSFLLLDSLLVCQIIAGGEIFGCIYFQRVLALLRIRNWFAESIFISPQLPLLPLWFSFIYIYIYRCVDVCVCLRMRVVMY